MSKIRTIIHIVVFLVAALLLWASPSIFEPKTVQLPLEENTYDLTLYDFEDTVYVTAPSWQSWPERIYTPDELAGAEKPVPHQSLDYTSVQYATHRLTMTLPANKTFGISLNSSDYAMRLFINGEEVDSIGVPGATREETEPRVKQVAYYFTSQSEPTEFVAQAANFVHKEGSWAPILTVGEAQTIGQMQRISDLKDGLIVGCFITAFLFHLAIFILNRRQRNSLLFSALCLLMALHSSRVFVQLIQGYDWYLFIRAEYLIVVGIYATIFLLIWHLFARTLNRWIARTFLGLCGLFALFVIAADPTVSSRVLIAFQFLSIIMVLLILIRLATDIKSMGTKGVLAFSGICVIVLSGVIATLHSNGFGFDGMNEVFPLSIGMVFFVFCYALILSIEQSEVTLRLQEARLAIEDAESRYEKLISAQQPTAMQQTRLSDFGLTKRETEVALLLLDGKSRDEIAQILWVSLGTVNTHCTNIYRKSGCKGVAELTRFILPGIAKTEQ